MVVLGKLLERALRLQREIEGGVAEGRAEGDSRFINRRELKRQGGYCAGAEKEWAVIPLDDDKGFQDIQHKQTSSPPWQRGGEIPPRR